MPQTEMFNRRTGMPRLCSRAGRVLGAALNSTSRFTSSVRNWSGVCHKRKRSLSV